MTRCNRKPGPHVTVRDAAVPDRETATVLLGSLRVRARWGQILLLVLALLTWLIQLLNTALYWAAISNGAPGNLG